jgi:hypothetical protein
MKPLSFAGKIVLVSLLCLYTSIAYTQPHAKIPQESGFNGFVSAGPGLWRIEDNLVKEIWYFQVSENEINSIDDRPKAKYSVTPILSYNVGYTFASTRTQIFLGSLLEDLLRFDTATHLGVRQELPDQSVIGVSYVFSPYVFEVYKDPYVEGKNRKGTDRTIHGVRLSYGNILGSDLSFQYTYRNIDLDNERSGRQLVRDGVLTGSQADRLDRNGSKHDAEVLYRFVSQRGASQHAFVPSFKYSYLDLDGSAMKHNYFQFSLNYRYDVEKFAVVLDGHYGYADYDNRNPIYGKTREDDRYGFGLLGFYKRFLGVEDLHLNLTVAINRGDSNIDFYDSEMDLYSLSLFYFF